MDEKEFLWYIRPMIRGLKTDELYNTNEQVDDIIDIIDKKLTTLIK